MPVVDIPRAALSGTWLGVVTSVQDPDSLGRVEVRLYAADGIDGHDAPLWARVAVPFAGNSYGAFFIPDVDDEVLVSFLQGDPRYPIVVGSLWNGANPPTETLGGSGDKIDRWTLTGHNGTRIAIVEEQAGAVISLETPQGVKATLKDESGGSLKIETPQHSITLDSSGITINSAAQCKVQASTVQVDASMVTVNAGMSKFSGVVKCDTLISNAVVSSSYTPGAGNVW